jgi:hypothetical protein
MRPPDRKNSRQQHPDVGTLWTMVRDDHAARCGLMSSRGSWYVRVVVDGTLLLEESYARADAAFMRAEHWRRRMTMLGWKQVLPTSVPGDRRPSAH